jgi:repressor LexA
MELLDRAGAAIRDVVGPGLPLLGHVAAGEPILAEENVEEYIDTPSACGGDSGQYLLRVRGESMKNAGILDGDLVVVRQQETARDGEIIVALVEEEATVKRFYREGDRIRLQPENETMDPIFVRDVSVLGRVVGLMRSM